MSSSSASLIPTPSTSTQDQNYKKIVLITGANQGIGYETARLLALSPSSAYHILVASRFLPRGEAAVSALRAACPSSSTRSTFHSLQLDVTSDASIAAAAEHVWKPIEGRPQNAALSTREVFAKMYDTNVLGQVAVTEAFMPLLLQSQSQSQFPDPPRLIFLTSGLGSLARTADPSDRYYNFPGITAYRSTKAALNMVMVEYSKQMKEHGGLVWGVCPGFRATMLSGSRERAAAMGAGDPADGGRVVVDVVEGRRDAETGKVVYEEEVRPW